MPKPVSLISGAAGFIGSHLADELIKRGHIVVVLDDLSGGFRENIHPHALFAQGSILDQNLIEKIFKHHRFDYVFHLAAYAAEGLSHFIKSFNYMNNLVGSVNLINAAVNHKVKRFIFTSSMAVYGAAQTPFQESMRPDPEDSYGIAKAAVEAELEISRRMFGLEYTIFRPHNVYGERQNIGDKYRNVVGIWMNQILQGNPMTIFGDGTQKRAFTYVRDIIPMIAGCVDVKATANGIFNIGADTPYTINELSQAVAEAMRAFPQMVNLPPRNEVHIAFTDHSRLKAVYGNYPRTSLDEGLRLMADWVKQHGARESKQFENIEITKKLPPSWAQRKAVTA